MLRGFVIDIDEEESIFNTLIKMAVPLESLDGITCMEALGIISPFIFFTCISYTIIKYSALVRYLFFICFMNRGVSTSYLCHQTMRSTGYCAAQP